MKINLGGGNQRIEGFTNVDIIKTEQGIQHDLNKYPYPFKDNSIEEIKAFHIIEHLDDYGKFFKEVFRILKVRGELHIKVPHFTSHGAFCEYHIHKGFWYYCFSNERLFTKTNLEIKDNIFNKFHEFQRSINFECKYPWNWLVSLLLKFPLMPQIYETTFLHSLFPAKEIEIKWVKEK